MALTSMTRPSSAVVSGPSSLPARVEGHEVPKSRIQSHSRATPTI